MAQIEVITEARVQYTCLLNDIDSQAVIECAAENDMDFAEAVNYLYNRGEIDLYGNSTESDFCTRSIDDAYEI